MSSSTLRSRFHEVVISNENGQWFAEWFTRDGEWIGCAGAWHDRAGARRFAEAQLRSLWRSLMTRKAKEFLRRAHLYLLKPEDLFREFEFNGTTYKVIGLDERDRRCPIVCDMGNGMTCGWSYHVVSRELKSVTT